LWAVNSEGEVYRISSGEGSASLFTDLDQPVSLAPVVANNTLYILDDSGRITAFR
jgi:outer membrane protein assembly factor BamB